jgi:hypothetical protein
MLLAVKEQMYRGVKALCVWDYRRYHGLCVMCGSLKRNGIAMLLLAEICMVWMQGCSSDVKGLKLDR